MTERKMSVLDDYGEVKPEPLELWVNVYPGHDCAYSTKEAAVKAVMDDGVTILFRQVLDEDS